MKVLVFFCHDVNKSFCLYFTQTFCQQIGLRCLTIRFFFIGKSVLLPLAFPEGSGVIFKSCVFFSNVTAWCLKKLLEFRASGNENFQEKNLPPCPPPQPPTPTAAWVKRMSISSILGRFCVSLVGNLYPNAFLCGRTTHQF